MPRYLLDTNACSHVIKGTHGQVRAHLHRISPSQVSISTITQAELLFGIAKKTDAEGLRAAVHGFLAYVQIEAWDAEAARCYGEMRADLESRGLPLGNMDMLIAAHALALDAVLVTSDRSFNNVKGLRVSDWAKLPR